MTKQTEVQELKAMVSELQAQVEKLSKKPAPRKRASKKAAAPAKPVVTAETPGAIRVAVPAGLKAQKNAKGTWYVITPAGGHTLVGASDVANGVLKTDKSFFYVPKKARRHIEQHAAHTCTCNDKTGWTCPAVRDGLVATA